jgi:hypothetical protein
MALEGVVPGTAQIERMSDDKIIERLAVPSIISSNPEYMGWLGLLPFQDSNEVTAESPAKEAANKIAWKPSEFGTSNPKDQHEACTNT